MNKTIILVLAFAVAIVAFFGFYLFFKGLHSGQQNTSNTITPIIYNTSTSGGNTNATSVTTAGTATIRVPLQNGNTIAVSDFKNASSTVKDPNNAGYYYLAGGAKPAITHPPYQIFYTDSDMGFTITLYRQPLSEYRLLAQTQLMHILGTNAVVMCNLNYSVAAVNGLDPQYDGTNLGFSFCPGATLLPSQ